MALGMRHWTLLAAAACAAVAGITLPPEPPERLREQASPPEVRRANAIQLRLTLANEALRRVRWSDSLVALIQGAAERATPFVFGVPEELRAAAGGTWDYQAMATARIAAELEALSVDPPAVDVGVFLVDGRSGGATDLSLSVATRVEWYAGVAGGRPYCMVVRTSRDPADLDLVSGRWSGEGRDPVTSMLGACRVYARYGIPGAGVQRWMEGPGADLASDRLERPGRETPTGAGKGWFFRRGDVRQEALRYEGCAAGRMEACASIVLEKASDRDVVDDGEDYIRAAGAPLLGGRPALEGSYSAYEIRASRTIDELEERFGTETFRRFWTSEREVSDAFTEAFGMTPAQWGYDMARSVGGVDERASILPSPSDGALALLYTLVAVILGIGLARGRRSA